MTEVLVNGRPLEEYLGENESAVSNADAGRKEAMQRYRRTHWAKDIPDKPGGNSRTSQRSMKHKARHRVIGLRVT